MRRLALFFSVVFHPILLPTAGLIVVFSLNTYLAQTTPLAKQAFIVGWIFLNTAVIPLAFTLFLRWRGLISSVQLELRQDRIVPFAFALVFYLTNYWLLRDVPMPAIIYSMFLGSSVAVGLALVFTLFTKVSIHMIGMGGFAAAVFGMGQIFGVDVALLLVGAIAASGVVGSARYLLESHTLSQIYMGWLIGFFTVYVPMHYSWG